MAERVGFEPTLEFPLNTLSKRAPSATRPSLQRRESPLKLTHFGMAELPTPGMGPSREDGDQDCYINAL